MPRVLQLFNVFGATTERALLDYTLGLSRSGFEMTFACETLGSDVRAGMPVVRLHRVLVEPTDDVPGQMERVAREVDDLARLELLHDRFDLVHGHFGPRILHGAAWLQRGVPMIVSTYGYDVGRLLRDACWIERYRWAAEHGATFVALAESMVQVLLGHGLPRERVRRIHLGIDLSEHAYDPGPAPREPRFVFIGRFVDKKGTDVLIEALGNLVHEAHVPATIDLIGGGPNEALLRAQVQRLGLTSHVRFVGLVPFGKLFDYLSDCTALVQPSFTAADGDAEGAPMVLMTAQASGVPCITTWHSGNPETIPPIGQRFIVPERDAGALVGAMSAMVDLPATDRSALQAAGRRWIEERFDLRETVRQYAMLYRELTPATS